MEQAIIFLADFKLVPNWLEGTTNGPIGSILYNPSWCSPFSTTLPVWMSFTRQ